MYIYLFLLFLFEGYTGYDQHQWPSMPQQQKSDQNVATETASQSRDNTFSANQNLPFQDQFHNQITGKILKCYQNEFCSDLKIKFHLGGKRHSEKKMSVKYCSDILKLKKKKCFHWLLDKTSPL